MGFNSGFKGLTWSLVRDVLLSSDRGHTPIVVGKRKTGTSL